MQVTSFDPFAGILQTVFLPVWRTQNAVSLEAARFIGLLKSKRDLVEENEILRQKNKELETGRHMREELALENEALKELLGRNESVNTILASVLAQPNVSPYDTLVIDVGSKENVAVGDRVVVYGDFVVGKVAETRVRTSLVKLFSSPKEKNNVLISSINLLVTAEGRGGGNFEIKLPRGVSVSEGDSIIIPGNNTKIFGIVEKIVATPTGAFQTILFKSPVNMQEVRFVEVLRDQ